jgi:hypothetical protein
MTGKAEAKAAAAAAMSKGISKKGAAAVAAQIQSMQRIQLYEWGMRRFVGGLSKNSDWVQYQTFIGLVVDGDWSQVGSLVFHTVLPERMPSLAARFTEEVDAEWVRRYNANDPNA